MKRKDKENNNIIGDAIVGVVATVVSVITLSKKDIEVKEEKLRQDIEDRNNDGNTLNKENEGLAYHFYFRYDKRYKKIKVDNFQTFIEDMNNLLQKQNKKRKTRDKINVILTSGIELTDDITIDGSNTIEIEGENYGFDQIYLTLIGKLTFGNNNKKIRIFYNNVGDNTETLKDNNDDTKPYGYLKGYIGLLYPVSSLKNEDKEINYFNSPKIKNIVVNSYDQNTNHLNTNIKKEGSNTSYSGSSYLVQYKSPYFNLVNCINKNNIKTTENDCGGLCGAYTGYQGKCILTYCINHGEIRAKDAGGLCGTLAGKYGECILNDCVNKGEIMAKFAGGLCGSYVGYEGVCTLTNCKNIGNILETAQYSGGLCGYGAGKNGYCKLNNCVNKGEIRGQHAGGLCGREAGSYGKCFLNDCVNEGEIRAVYAGGLCGSSAGRNNNGECILTNCKNIGNIFVTAQKAGGFCGYLAGSNGGKCFLNDCVNEGEIMAPKAGGFCGEKSGIYNDSECILTNCKNIGNIVETAQFSGGFCGSDAGINGGKCSLNNCVNEGEIRATEAGGLCGKFAGSTNGKCILTNCKNIGNILETAEYSGGLFGAQAGGSLIDNQVNDGYCKLINCVNEGEIRAKYAGGLCGNRAGNRGQCFLENCVNKGEIRGEQAGGFCGSNAGSYDGKCSLIECENSGIIYGLYAGGFCGFFAGYNRGNCSLIKCENSGFIYGDYSGGLYGSGAGSNLGICTVRACKNSGDIYGNKVGGFYGTKVGINKGHIIINDNCQNIGILNNSTDSGQLFGSISEVEVELIEIYKNTVVLQQNFQDSNSTTNLEFINNKNKVAELSTLKISGTADNLSKITLKDE